MDVRAIGAELVKGCREGRERENIDRLYAADAVSVEAADQSGQGRETRGRDAIHGKHDWWDGAMEEHEVKVEGPFVHGADRFGVIFEVDATEKETGERHRMKELGIYHVADGRIVREEFFYAM